MSAATMAQPARPQPRMTFDLGRPFVNTMFDLLVIGGGLSLLFVAFLRLAGPLALPATALWTIVLLVNSAHFAASTVRLYTKEGSFRDLPFVTMGLPLAALLVLGLALLYPAAIGRHMMALYFTWSPYHYAAQSYGLAVMYTYRSGASLSLRDKRLLRAACLLPFAYAFLSARGAGIEWLIPSSALPGEGWAYARALGLRVLGVLVFAAPVALFARGVLTAKARLPLISLVAMIANGSWWVTLTYWDAFIWATIFHGLQYLAIALVFHVRDRQRLETPPPRPWWRHALGFYAACLGLGYLLFQVWPHAGPLVGFAYAHSLLLVVATINIHHFIVDAFIWRLRKDPNYKIVAAAAAPAA